MEVVFDLGAFGHLEAHFAEQPLDAQARARHRMQAAGLLAAAIERHVDAPLGQLARDLLGFEHRAARVDGGLHGILGFVDARAGCWRSLRGHGAQRLQLLGEQSLLAQPVHAHFIQARDIGAGGDFRQRTCR